MTLKEIAKRDFMMTLFLKLKIIMRWSKEVHDLNPRKFLGGLVNFSFC